jgi:2Fe-2S ferredoxin
VLLDEEWMRRLPPRRYEERVMLATSRSFDPQRSRLSCQITVTADLDGLRLMVAPDDL